MCPCAVQVVVNEEEDPYLAMQRLRQQVADLQAELRCTPRPFEGRAPA